MRLPDGWNWREPDYGRIFEMRMAALRRIRAEPECLPELKAWYREHPDDFINDWGMTFDPRLVKRGLPALVPFLLFDRQREFVRWTLERWLNDEPGIGEKSRDMGLSWLLISLACTLCLHYPGMAIGFGSRKEEYVDKIGSPKSMFQKGRIFMANLPIEFRGGWQANRDAPYMRMMFPETGAVLTGEAGDQIGRGDRAGIYVVDESAHLERPELVDAALSQTTNCRIDISSVNGMNNSFATKRHGGNIPVFVFDWHDDPRKDAEWYAKQQTILDPVVLAQEVDRDYTASVEGIVIPNAWIQAAIDAHQKLGIAPTGSHDTALDIADEGSDRNAFGAKIGVEVVRLEEWSGKGSDIFRTIESAFLYADEHSARKLRYDADGLGAGARGDARVINERRRDQGNHAIGMEAFRGSAGVFEPEREDFIGRTNQDFFANAKAQAWWALRARFQRTFRWVTEGIRCAPDDIISINTKRLGPIWQKLVTELGQPTYSVNGAGKVLIDKMPDGQKSPNLGDVVMMLFAQVAADGLNVTPEVLATVLAAGRGGRRRG